MCGIVGIISKHNFSIKNSLLKSLKKLEYRGYDSVGFATKDGTIKKDIGFIDPFIEKTKDTETNLAISHTRWSTHGGITITNAHPHANKEKTIIALHNGIIENYLEIKQDLESAGYLFTTQTDTEIIPHFFDYELNKKKQTMQKAIQEFFKQVHGTFAILLILKNQNILYALKRDSPLVLGIAQDKFIFASDIYAFSDVTNKAIFFEDNEYAIATQEKFTFYDKEGNEIKKNVQEFSWSKEEESKQHYPHHMIKEIKEQPETSNRLIQSFATIQKNRIDKLVQLIRESKSIVFLGCGTSYHASLIGAILLSHQGINCRSNIASEAESFVSYDKETLCIAISQSGETMDVISELKRAKAVGATIASIVNVPYSTIQRFSETSIEILAGQEVCVAATKTFTNQVIVMLELARRFGYKINMQTISEKIKQTITDNEEKIKQLAEELCRKKDIFVLGKGMSYPMAREIALKLKEIDYIHAEGMMAGELKHGTIALIEEGTPVISLVPNDNKDMLSATQEVKARGAKTIIISNLKDKGDIIVPQSDTAEFAIYAGIIGHLLSYYIGVLLNVSIDKPRNLAKSCTVK
ncbi:glutamine--fructose-6-phosphate transaminase (isomerizing) [Candidatus Woesearchaeota archaeon]|nr:glutamine--fructose-6-phosphate transaminase (isomerizing) [Candidatus Woesearchaeota archaeon]